MTDIIIKSQLKGILSLIKNQLPKEEITAYKLTVHKNLESVFLIVNEKQYELPGKESLVKEGILTLSKLYAKGDVIGAEIFYDSLTNKVTGTFFTTINGEKNTESLTI